MAANIKILYLKNLTLNSLNSTCRYANLNALEELLLLSVVELPLIQLLAQF